MTKVRVSIGNLVTQIRNSETGKVHFVGLLNRKALTQGRRLYAAIGGAAEVTPAGKERLEQRYDAEFQEGMDARFVVDEERLENVFNFFGERNSSLCETDPSREILEELTTKELPIQDTPALSPEEATGLKVEFLFSYRQPVPEGKGTSAREGEIPTRRLFLCFEIIATGAVIEKFAACPAIKFFSREELETTEHGTRQGEAIDGSALADNLFLKGIDPKKQERPMFAESRPRKTREVAAAEGKISRLEKWLESLRWNSADLSDDDLVARIQTTISARLTETQDALAVALRKQEAVAVYHQLVPAEWFTLEKEYRHSSMAWTWCWGHQRYCQCESYIPHIDLEYEGETRCRIEDLLLVDWKVD